MRDSMAVALTPLCGSQGLLLALNWTKGSKLRSFAPYQPPMWALPARAMFVALAFGGTRYLDRVAGLAASRHMCATYDRVADTISPPQRQIRSDWSMFSPPQPRMASS